MAHYKQGLDYFSMEVHNFGEPSLRYLRRDYGSAAVDLWLTLLSVIYSDNGYYIWLKGFKYDDFIWDIRGLINGKDVPDMDTIKSMIHDFMHYGMLDEDMYCTHGILTSKRIQKQFYMSTVKRKCVEVNPDYWMLSVPEMTALSEKSPILFSLALSQEPPTP